MEMSTNVLRLIRNIETASKDLSKIMVLSKSGNSLNRANGMGDALEAFVKDAFSGSIGETDPEKKRVAYERSFSWLGSQNNPPDIIIRNGDAIEVKKFIGARGGSELQLNSSYPKAKLRYDNPRITKECRDCESSWKEKDMIYCVGSVQSDKLKYLVMVYGDLYAADMDVYERLERAIVSGLKTTGLDFSKTKELGRVNGVDPLKITNLRIRPMWLIQSPTKVFEDVFGKNDGSETVVMVLMSSSKYSSLPAADRKYVEERKSVSVKNVKVRDPSNPAKSLDAKLVAYTF